MKVYCLDLKLELLIVKGEERRKDLIKEMKMRDEAMGSQKIEEYEVN